MKSDVVISFAAGLVTGVAVAYLLITDRLQRQMDQEIEERVDEVEKSAFQEYRENIDKLTAMYENKEEKEALEYKPSENPNIEILDPQTFQEGMLGYEFFEVRLATSTIMWMADDNGNRMKESAEELIGSEAMKSGGAYGADPHDVFVRNTQVFAWTVMSISSTSTGLKISTGQVTTTPETTIQNDDWRRIFRIPSPTCRRRLPSRSM